MTEVIKIIDNAQTRDDVREALQGLRVKELKEIAAHYDVFVAKAPKAVVVERIVQATVGRNLDGLTIRKLEL